MDGVDVDIDHGSSDVNFFAIDVDCGAPTCFAVQPFRFLWTAQASPCQQKTAGRGHLQ